MWPVCAHQGTRLISFGPRLLAFRRPAIMNNSAGLQAVLANPRAVPTLALCLASGVLKLKLIVVELLGAVW